MSYSTKHLQYASKPSGRPQTRNHIARQPYTRLADYENKIDKCHPDNPLQLKVGSPLAHAHYSTILESSWSSQWHTGA